MSVEQADEDGLVLKLPYSDAIVGNPFTGVVHGGYFCLRVLYLLLGYAPIQLRFGAGWLSPYRW